jgi:hypothetical protein
MSACLKNLCFFKIDLFSRLGSVIKNDDPDPLKKKLTHPVQ